MTTFVADESTNFPYSAVTYVEATFPDGTRVSGSGAVVGINDVLTAAHVVYSPENGGMAEQVTVYPGHDGQSIRQAAMRPTMPSITSWSRPRREADRAREPG